MRAARRGPGRPLGHAGKLIGELGGEGGGEPFELAGITGHEQFQFRAEAQGVLDGMEAFEDGQRRIASRTAEARDERSVSHRSDDRTCGLR